MRHSKLLKLDSEKKSWVACVYYWPFTVQLLLYFSMYKIINFNFAAHSIPVAHIDPKIHVVPLTAALRLVSSFKTSAQLQ